MTEINEDYIKALSDLELVSFIHQVKKNREDKKWGAVAKVELDRRTRERKEKSLAASEEE